MTKESADVEPEGPVEIALVGDLTDHEGELADRLLSVPAGGRCTLYIDSPGGSPYCALALTSLIRLRRLKATGIVTGECSSATLWPFAACQRRIVTPFSVLLFHPMKWQSEEHVALAEAAEWARHFGTLERDMDQLLADLLGISFEQLSDWVRPGRYVSGPEFAAAGLAELVPLTAPRPRGESPTEAQPAAGGKRKAAKRATGHTHAGQPAAKSGTRNRRK